MLRPRLKLPLWAAVAIPAAAYLIRAAMRGTLRPDLPGDAVVVGALLLVLLLAAISKRRGDEPNGELNDEHAAEGDRRKDHEV